MDWSPKQQRALDDVGRWLRGGSNQQVFRLFGYAGTGKTTLAKHLAESAGTVLFAAYTGKAAHVLRTRGCFGASTIHSLIYMPSEPGTQRIEELNERLDHTTNELAAEYRAEGVVDIEAELSKHPEVRQLRSEIEKERNAKKRPTFHLKLDSELADADLLVIDECSMVDEEMAHNLLSFGVKILVLGDPAQLPPVRGCGYFTDAKPDIILTEIHRQARDNPIIDLATQVREGRQLQVGKYGDSQVLLARDCNKDFYLGHDQMLVGRNKTRRACNAEYRRLLGRDGQPTPLPGDRLVCLRNNHDIGLLNGSIWEVESAQMPFQNRIVLGIKPLDGIGQAQEVVAHEQYFHGAEPPYFEVREAQCFDYGYVLTCHKAQGSQWDRVLILDESSCFKEHSDRWLYTAITRAAEKVTVVVR